MTEKESAHALARSAAGRECRRVDAVAVVLGEADHGEALPGAGRTGQIWKLGRRLRYGHRPW